MNRAILPYLLNWAVAPPQLRHQSFVMLGDCFLDIAPNKLMLIRHIVKPHYKGQQHGLEYPNIDALQIGEVLNTPYASCD